MPGRIQRLARRMCALPILVGVLMDLDVLLEPIAGDNPCGEEGSLFALEEIVKEQGVGVIAGAEVEAAEPNWLELQEKALEHFKSCKHLRTALFLALAAMKRQGVTGFRDGLLLAQGMIERYWDTMYPELDPDESMGDPDGWMERENILNDMSAPLSTAGDTMKFLQRLRETPLTNSRQLGRYSLRDIQAAMAAANDEGADAPKMSLILGAFEDTPLPDLEAMYQALTESLETLDAIKSALRERLKESTPPTFANLAGMLQDMKKPVHNELDRRGYFASGVEAEAASEEVAGEATGGDGAPAKRADMGSAGINTRQDVLKAFDLIYKYYSKNEPSSPVPLIMKRAERLVTANFFDIISDLSPGALSDIETITGASLSGLMNSGDGAAVEDN
jgi:type VI secretion system protein ImpA